MDIPWYGYLLSLLGFWGVGYYSGVKAGVGSALQMVMAQQAKMQQMAGLPPNMPGLGGGPRAGL